MQHRLTSGTFLCSPNEFSFSNQAGQHNGATQLKVGHLPLNHTHPSLPRRSQFRRAELQEASSTAVGDAVQTARKTNLDGAAEHDRRRLELVADTRREP